jgi:ribose transport system substrate-binding protein
MMDRLRPREIVYREDRRRLGVIVVVFLASFLLTVGAAGAASQIPASTNTDPIAQARANVKKLAKPVSWSGPTTRIPMARLRGKTIWNIEVTATPFVLHVEAGLKEAAKAAGIKVVGFNGKGTPSEWNKGVQAAVGAHAAGIILQSTDPNLISGPLKAARKAGIPVIDSDVDHPGTPLYPGIFAHVSANYFERGKQLADYALATSGTHTNAAIFIDPKNKVFRNLKNGFLSEMAKCDTCKATAVNFSDAATAQEIPSKASSLLLRDSTINWMSGFDYEVAFILQGIRAAGKQASVRVVASDAVASNLDSIRNGHGQGQVADIGGPSDWKGWAELDELGRAMLKMKPIIDEKVPVRLLTAKNLPPPGKNVFGNFDFRARYLKLWGLK